MQAVEQRRQGGPGGHKRGQAGVGLYDVQQRVLSRDQVRVLQFPLLPGLCLLNPCSQTSPANCQPVVAVLHFQLGEVRVPYQAAVKRAAETGTSDG